METDWRKWFTELPCPPTPTCPRPRPLQVLQLSSTLAVCFRTADPMGGASFMLLLPRPPFCCHAPSDTTPSPAVMPLLPPSFPLLLPHLPCRSGLYPHIVSQNKSYPSEVLFVRIFCHRKNKNEERLPKYGSLF